MLWETFEKVSRGPFKTFCDYVRTHPPGSFDPTFSKVGGGGGAEPRESAFLFAKLFLCASTLKEKASVDTRETLHHNRETSG